ncbi:MAG: hypothetical protein WA418_25355 [Bradyrhizobium sp.]
MLAVCVISYAIAVLMPSWRALLVATLLVLLATLIDGLRHGWSPELNGCRPGCKLDDLLVIPLLPFARAGFMTGAIIRALTFLPQARGLSSRAVVMICIAGSALAIATVLFAPSIVFWRPPWLR